MSSDFEIVVAGGGIAGLTAGLRATQLGRKTLVLTGFQLGGNLLSIDRIDGHPDYPDGIAGYDLVPMIQSEASEAGAEFAATELVRFDGAPGAWRLSTAAGEIEARAVVLATGAAPKMLGIPGEAAFTGRGVSHCASCDAPLLRDKVVVVVGGGDSALQESLTLAEAVARVIIVQEGETLTAQQVYIDRVRQHLRIEVRFGTTVTEIAGNERVTGVRLTGGDEVACDAVFVYVGLEPNTGYLNGKLSLDSAARVPTDRGMATELSGLFAAGLVRSGSPGRAAISADEGKAAAEAADRFLRNGG
jgi:thioredoxin reductase (NADPH)